MEKEITIYAEAIAKNLLFGGKLGVDVVLECTDSTLQKTKP